MRRTLAHVTLVALLVAGCAVAASPTPPAGGSPSPPAATPSPRPSESVGPSPSPTPQPAGVVARIDLPGQDVPGPVVAATALAFDSLWLEPAARLDPFLLRIDLATNRVAATIPLGVGGAIALGERAIWLGGTTLELIDPDSGRVVARLALDVGGPIAAGLGAVWVPGSDGRLRRVDPARMKVVAAWPVPGHPVVACDALWVIDSGGEPGTVAKRLDPATGRELARFSDANGGARWIAAAAGSCWTLLGSQDEENRPPTAWIARVDPEGNLERSPALHARVRLLGDTFWTWTYRGLIQRIDPLTGEPIGPAWRLPPEATPGGGWTLIAGGGSAWLVTRRQLLRLDIPTGG